MAQNLLHSESNAKLIIPSRDTAARLAMHYMYIIILVPYMYIIILVPLVPYMYIIILVPYRVGQQK